MRHQFISAMTVLSLCTALAASEPMPDRMTIGTAGLWTIDNSNCSVELAWKASGGVTVRPHDDHYDFGIFDAGLTGVELEKTVDIRLGGSGTYDDATELPANGVEDLGTRGYVSAVAPDLLARIEADRMVRLFRDGRLLSRIEMTGFGEARAEMAACEIALIAASDINAADPAIMETGDAAAAAAAAAEAAIDEANSAMTTESVNAADMDVSGTEPDYAPKL